MAKKSITAASSAQDRRRAAEELRAAQDELNRYLIARRNDPTTPREIFEGEDFGPLITAADIEAQGRLIARNYDYVDYGSTGLTSSGGNSVNLGSNEFFVPGFGSNPDSIANETNIRVPRTSDSALPPSNTGSTTPSGSNEPPSDSKVYGSNSASERFAPAPTGADPAGRASDTIPDGNTASLSSNSNTAGPTTIARNPFDDDGKDIASGGGTDGSNTQNRDNTQSSTAPASSGRADGDTPSSTTSTSTGKVDVGQFGQGTGAGTQESNPKEVEVRPNVLHGYSNWSYNIALYMMTPKQHNKLVEDGQVTSSGTDNQLSGLLVKSGGTGGKGILGSKKDYHLENLRLTSVIGQNARTTKSSNNFDITFDIVEPYGVTFLAELVQAAANRVIEDHIDTAYLLEIKFNGYDDAGKPYTAIPGAGPKYIPIKLIDIKFKIDSAATIYTVRAVPYAHSPLQDKSEAYIPEGIRLSGNTFGNVMANLIDHLNSSEASKAAEVGRSPNTYKTVIVDYELKDSKLAFVKSTDSSGGSTVSELSRVTFGNTGNSEDIQIAAGSTLKDAIQTIALHTEFGAKYNTTGTETSASGNESRPFRLVKIIPVVEIGDYNSESRLYTKRITYKVETEKKYGMLFNGMPAAKAESRGWAKEYNWIFTGKNQDIVDFNAEYNLQYFYIKSNYVDAKSSTTGTPSRLASQSSTNNDTRTTTVQTPAGPKQTRSSNNAQAPAIRPANALSTGSNVANPNKGAAYQLAADHMDNVLNNPQGDMVVVDLTIIGDPDWIPQDASILPHGDRPSTDSVIDRHGSIAVDGHAALLTLAFRTPRDYDAVSGLMKMDTDQTFVQGKYQVITVTSTFTDGKFEQQLKCVRLQNQDSNDASKSPDLSVGYDEGEVDPGLAAAVSRTDSRVSVSAPTADTEG